jgi:hypothetical protein
MSKEVIKRFWDKVDKTSDCWNWFAALDGRGYGKIKIASYVLKQAHRLSWEIHNGEIPAGLNVCHHCDNPRCVRPDHLFLGTTRDNHDDCSNKGRRAKGAMLPHSKLTEDAVKKIRQSASSYRELAAVYGVSKGTVWDAKTGRTWKQVMT